MKFKIRRPPLFQEHDTYVKAKHRARLMGISDMIDWIDNTGSTMAMNLAEFRRNRDPKIISEIRNCALAIVALTDTMEERFDSIGK